MKLLLALFITAATLTAIPNNQNVQDTTSNVQTVVIQHTQQPIVETIVTPVEQETTPIPEPIPTCPAGSTPLEVLADGTHTSCLPDECWHMIVSEETPQCLYGIKP